MHVKIEEGLKEYKNSLESREASYIEQAKLGNRITGFGMFLALMGFFVPLLLITPFKDAQAFLAVVVVLLMAVGLSLAYWGRRINDKKGIPRLPIQYLTSDEKIFLEVFKSLTNLADYLNEPENVRQDSRKSEPLRIQGLKCMRETYGLLNGAWQSSDIKVVMKTIGNDMVDFKEEFGRSLIYTVESATKKENVETSFNILTRFANFLRDPTKELLVKLKQDIKAEQETSQLLRTDKLSPRYPILDTILRRGILQHLAILGTIFAVAFCSAFVPFSLAHIDMNTAILVFAAIFGPSLAVYLDFAFRRWKPKS